MASSSVNGSKALGREIAKRLTVEITIKASEVEGFALDALMEKFSDGVLDSVRTFFEGCHTSDGREAVRTGCHALALALEMAIEQPKHAEVSDDAADV